MMKTLIVKLLTGKVIAIACVVSILSVVSYNTFVGGSSLVVIKEGNYYKMSGDIRILFKKKEIVAPITVKVWADEKEISGIEDRISEKMIKGIFIDSPLQHYVSNDWNTIRFKAHRINAKVEDYLNDRNADRVELFMSKVKDVLWSKVDDYYVPVTLN